MDIFSLWNDQLYPASEKTDAKGTHLIRGQENEDALGDIGVDSEADGSNDFVCTFKLFNFQYPVSLIQFLFRHIPMVLQNPQMIVPLS